MSAAPIAAGLAARFARDGFVVHAEPVVPAEALVGVAEAMDRVAAGDYATGVAPGRRYWEPGGDPTELVKVDFAHVSDPVLSELVRRPEIGAFAASLVGAELVQVWAAQMLVKPPGGGSAGNVGWHQDDTYWSQLWEGEVFTVWLAVEAVTPDLGPLLYVPGSHEWGPQAGDFFSSDLDATRAAVAAGDWVEQPAVLQAGGASAHHKLTVHGSAANTGTRSRRGFALHLRTERSRLVGHDDLVSTHLDDEDYCPVIYRT